MIFSSGTTAGRYERRNRTAPRYFRSHRLDSWLLFYDVFSLGIFHRCFVQILHQWRTNGVQARGWKGFSLSTDKKTNAMHRYPVLSRAFLTVACWRCFNDLFPCANVYFRCIFDFERSLSSECVTVTRYRGLSWHPSFVKWESWLSQHFSKWVDTRDRSTSLKIYGIA